MAKILDAAVSQSENGMWDFRCPGFSDSRCGAGGIPFYSTAWPTKKAAMARGFDHLNEHKIGEETRELGQFRTDENIEVGDLAEMSGLSVKDI